MDNYIITPTKYTPEIVFNCAAGTLDIRGVSYPENVMAFYEPFFTRIKECLKTFERQPLNVNVELSYFNSSSSKKLMDLFDLLDDAAGTGKNITINWLYESDDEDSLEYGEDFKEDLEHVTFNLVKI